MMSIRIPNKRILGAIALFSLSLMTAAPAAAQDDVRLALVIGNGRYADAEAPIANAATDSKAVAEEFRRLSYDVTLKQDLKREELHETVRAFTAKIKPGTTAVFYFTGIGLQVDRQTYLIPVDAKIWTKNDVRHEGINADALLAEMHGKGAKTKIVILDAARRNPFERRFRLVAEGLAPITAPVGTLVLCSNALNRALYDRSADGHSVFAAELIKELRSPNLAAEEVFKRARVGVSRISGGEQVPWLSSSLVAELYLGGRSVIQ